MSVPDADNFLVGAHINVSSNPCLCLRDTEARNEFYPGISGSDTSIHFLKSAAPRKIQCLKKTYLYVHCSTFCSSKPENMYGIIAVKITA